MQESIYSLTYLKLEEWVINQGHKKFRVDQIWQWLYKHLVESFDEMTNVPEKLRDDLAESFSFSPLETVIVQQSKEDGTTKFLFKLYDETMIETVLMYQSYGQSVCVTTQIGCNIGCKFCASGLIPKQRDLSTGEIVAQIVNIERFLKKDDPDARVTNIVVMGIGEPFDNYDNVMDFFRVVNHEKGLGIGTRRMTVSTSGLAPRIRDFAHEDFQVNLALSLHAPNDEVRSYLMRINNKYPLDELMDAIGEYIDVTNRRVTMEYIMIDGVNDQLEHAKELVQLLKPFGHLVHVNLIPYNPVAENPFKRSTKEAILNFYEVLLKGHVQCTVRQEMGTDIEAACGQLRSQYMRKKRRPRPVRG